MDAEDPRTTLDKANAAAAAGDGAGAKELLRSIIDNYPHSREAVVARQALSGARAIEKVQLVRVVDFDVSFWSMVVLFVKAAIAAIPAVFILFLIGMGITLALAPLYAVLGAVMR